MLDRVRAAFLEAPEAPRLEDPEKIQDLYATRRKHVLLGSMVAYALFYFVRKNISMAKPLLKQQLSSVEMGRIDFAMYATYGTCKFLSGLFADRLNPRTFMLAGLGLSIGANVVFGLTPASLLWLLVVVWGLNGVVQSTGAVASAKVIARWFSVSERGTMTGIWNISHQGGGAIALILAGLFISYTGWGWRGAFIGPAIVALVGAVLVARYLHDRPEADGLPPIEFHRNDYAAAEDENEKVPFARLVVTKVLLNPRVWLIALASGCTYIVRFGPLDWCPLYLYDQAGGKSSNVFIYAVQSSFLELFGIPGALVCGWLSDRLGSRRMPVACVSLLLLAASIWAFFNVPESALWLQWFLLAAMGFFTYGPQLLLAGVGPVDASSKRVAAAAIGFTGLVSYAGASIQSLASGALKESRFGWEGVCNFWVLSAVVGAALCVPLWNSSASKR